MFFSFGFAYKFLEIRGRISDPCVVGSIMERRRNMVSSSASLSWEDTDWSVPLPKKTIQMGGFQDGCVRAEA